MAAPSELPALPSPAVETKTKTRPRNKFEPLWYVILHDDQLHTYQYVIEMLVKLFEMSHEQAFLHAVEVDTRGVTIVARLEKAKAEQKRDEIMGYGGDPLMKTTVSMRATIEPADD
jgi:ATP-dependent Clp protease adaptor protein ClpS